MKNVLSRIFFVWILLFTLNLIWLFEKLHTARDKAQQTHWKVWALQADLEPYNGTMVPKSSLANDNF